MGPGAAASVLNNKPRSTRKLEQWHELGRSGVVIDVGMPIVDPHHHLFGAPEDRNFYRIEDLLQDLDTGHRVLGTVYVEAYESGWREGGPLALRPVGEVEMIMGKTPKPAITALGDCHIAEGVVSHADLTLGDAVEEVLTAQMEVARGRLRGVRQRVLTTLAAHAISGQSDRLAHMFADVKFRRGFSRMHALGLHFEVWVNHQQLCEVIELADAFPKTTIVVNHIGGPLGIGSLDDRRMDLAGEWATSLRFLAERANVRMKIGGMGMPVFGFGYERGKRPPAAAVLASAWKPLVEVCVNAFGADRCMFESNFPVDKQSCSYCELWNAFKLVTRGWAHGERCAMFYSTACTTYRLPGLQKLADAWLAAQSTQNS